MKGVVKWFNQSKGFGFLTAPGINGDIFVHYSVIQMDGFKTLDDRAQVEFEMIETPKGFQATNVKVTA